MSNVDHHPVLPGERVGVDETTFIEAEVTSKLLFNVDHLLMVESSVTNNLEERRRNYGIITSIDEDHGNTNIPEMVAAAHGGVEVTEIIKSSQSPSVEIIQFIESRSVQHLALIHTCLPLHLISEQHSLPPEILSYDWSKQIKGEQILCSDWLIPSNHRLHRLCHGVQIQSSESFPLQQQTHGLVSIVSLTHGDT